MDDQITFIFKNVLPPVILTVCLFSDIITFNIFVKLKKIQSRNLFLWNSFFQILTILSGLSFILSSSFDVMLSKSMCKLVRYININLNSITTWTLVYINIERLLNIYLNNFEFWKNGKFQIFIIGIIILENSVVNVPIAINRFDILEPNNTSNFFKKKNKQTLQFIRNF